MSSDAPVPNESPSTGRIVALAAALLAASNFVSRILGWAREILITALEGPTANADAYYTAFVIPDILNYLVAGAALSIAFLPFYTRALERSEEEAEELLATILGFLVPLAILSTVGLWVGADWIFEHWKGFAPETARLTARLTRIVLPAQICFVIGGIINATLFARNRFGAAALAPLLYNFFTIALGWPLHGRVGMDGFAWGILVGAITGPLLCPAIDAWRCGIRLRVRISPGSRVLWQYLYIAAPLMLGQSLLTIDEAFDKFFGARVGPSIVSTITFARKLMLVPVAVVGQAIATAALPTMTRMYAAGRITELNAAVQETSRAALGLSLLVAGGIFTFAKPIVVLLYERGRFGPEDSAAVAQLLQIFALAIPSWILQQIIVRAFYARAQTWEPMLLGTAVVVGVIPLYATLASQHGALGLAAAGAIAMTLNYAATLILAKRMHDAPELGSLGDTLARTGLAVCLAGALAIAVVGVLFGPGALDPETALAPLDCVWRLAVGGGVYGLATLALVLAIGDTPTRATLRRLLRLPTVAP